MASTKGKGIKMEKTLQMHLIDLRIEIAEDIIAVVGCDEAAAVARGSHG